MKQIRLSKKYGLFVLVDEQDYEWLMQWKWSASLESRETKFYAVRWKKINGKQRKIRMHVALVKRYGGKIPIGGVVNHKNDNSLDNRITNLEILKTQRENMNKSVGWVNQQRKVKNVR